MSDVMVPWVFEKRHALHNKSLFHAVANNDAEKIRRLIDQADFGANVNCEFTIDELIKDELLDKKAIAILTKNKITVAKLVKTMDIDYRTAGKLKGYEEVICLPVLANKIILSDDSKLSALQVAVLYGCKEAITELIKKGSNPNKALDIQGITILQLMCTAAVFRDKSCYAFDEKIIQLLFDCGADPNIQDVTGKRFLHYAVICGDFRIDEIVKSMKIMTDEASETIHHYKRIQKFLINGANPNVEDEFNLCNIVYDIFEHKRYLNIQEKLINLLIDSGCYYDKDSNLKPPEARGMILKIDSEIVQKATGNSSASSRVKDDVFQEMYDQRENKIQNLTKAVRDLNKSKIRLLLNEEISPNARDTAGFSLLHTAVERQETSVIELLFEKGADPNIKTWYGGETPLIIAVRSNSCEIVKLLIEHGAKPDILSAKGYSALYTSLFTKDEQDSMQKLLIHYGANPDMSREFLNLWNETTNVVKKIESEKNKAKSRVQGELYKFLNLVKEMVRFVKSKLISMDCGLLCDVRDIAKRYRIRGIAEMIQEINELVSVVPE